MSQLSREYRVVVTGDHGQVQVSSYVKIPKGELRKFGLEVPPFGELRSVLFLSRSDPTPLFKGHEVQVLVKGDLRTISGGDEVRITRFYPEVERPFTTGRTRSRSSQDCTAVCPRRNWRSHYACVETIHARHLKIRSK